MPSNLLRCGGLALVAAIAAAPASAGISGVYDSPLGKLRLSEKGGTVTARQADGKGPCGFKKGTKVLDASLLDDSLTGTLTTCKVGAGCSGKAEGMVMLLVTGKGSTMSGAVHIETGSCKTPVGGDAIRIKKRRGGAAAVKPKNPKGEDPKNPKGKDPKNPKGKDPRLKDPGHTGSGHSPRGKSARVQAEELAREAAQLMNTGQVEDARARFLQSVEVDPGYSEGYVGVGVTYYLRDRYEEALEYYKKGLEANPSNRDAYYNMACVYALSDDKDQALRYLRIAVLNGYVQLGTLEKDPDLKSLHGDEQFESLKSGGL
jgi:hypothetical protein